MTTETLNRLFDLSARVERIVHLGYMSPETDIPAYPLRELLEDLPHETLGRLLGLNEEQQSWLAEAPEDACEILCEISKFGFLIEIHGRIYRQISAGRYEGTCASAVEYAYAATAADIDVAINAALDRFEPRLRQPAESKAA